MVIVIIDMCCPAVAVDASVRMYVCLSVCLANARPVAPKLAEAVCASIGYLSFGWIIDSYFWMRAIWGRVNLVSFYIARTISNVNGIHSLIVCVTNIHSLFDNNKHNLQASLLVSSSPTFSLLFCVLFYVCFFSARSVCVDTRTRTEVEPALENLSFNSAAHSHPHRPRGVAAAATATQWATGSLSCLWHSRRSLLKMRRTAQGRERGIGGYGKFRRRKGSQTVRKLGYLDRKKRRGDQRKRERGRASKRPHVHSCK